MPIYGLQQELIRLKILPKRPLQTYEYTHSPKQSHEAALQRIGRYLKGTLKKDLVLHPSENFKIDCYPDADVAGLWTRDDNQDPHCVRS